MAGRPAAGRARRTPTWTLLLILGGLLASTAGAAALTPAVASPTSPSAHAPLAVVAPTIASHPSAPARPAVTNGTVGTTFTSTAIPPAANSNVPCWIDNYTTFIYNYCVPQTQSPTILELANGHFGVGYSILTTVGSLCNATGGSNLTSWTATNVAWSTSNTRGSHWGSAQIIGNSTCQWPASSMPTFATGTGDSVYGAFILSNSTVNATAPYGHQPLLPADWLNTTGDALGFVSSADNGTTWSNVSEVPGVTGAARPAMAVFGDTIYVVYVFSPSALANYTIGAYTYPGVSVAPSIDIVYSSNGGSTWNGPFTLPGENASFGNWSTSPSIAVNATGGLNVAYATNRSCVEYCFNPASAYFADDVVLSVSTNNGSSWSTPVTVAPRIGDSPHFMNFDDYYHYGFQGGWQFAPQTSIAIGSSASTIYVAYAGTYYETTGSFYNWEYSGVFAGVSTNGGAAWTTGPVKALVNSADDLYSPAIAYYSGTVYLAYVWMNNTYCSTITCSPFQESYSSWLATSTNGVAWSSTFTALSKMPYVNYYLEYQGWTSSIAFSTTGSPVTAAALPGAETDTYSYNGSAYIYRFNYGENVTIGYAYSGATTYALFTENNLTSGTRWGVSIDGYSTTSTGAQINISGIPISVGFNVAIISPPAGYGVLESSTLSIPSYDETTGPITAYVNFSIEFGVTFWIEPSVVTFVEIYINTATQYLYYESDFGHIYTDAAFPWYFPANQTLTFYQDSFDGPPITYWNGTGNGSYTGGGVELNLTLVGPVNETGWAGSYGVYSEAFQASGLPSTSTYSFTFDGSTYSSPATNTTIVSDVGTGGYSITNITANSSTSGWEYFGWVTGGSNVVVVPAEPTVGFDFAYVNVASPVGTVTFHAKGIGAGTVWSVGFNGTMYSSSTPWLNISTRPGTFPWSVGAAVAANASVGYAPVGAGSTVSVTTGSTVNISCTSAYRVDVVAGLGGTVSGAGNHWLATGTGTSYTAVPSNGYEFGSWTGTGAGSYTGTNLTATVTANGAITETASFYPLPDARFNVTFQETGIVSGAWWTVSLNGVGYSSNSSSLTVSDLLSCSAGTSGQYRESVGVAYDNASGTTRYVAVSPPAQFCTNGGLVQALTFAPQYAVSVSTTSGGTAYLADGTTVTNTSLWANPTDTVLLEEHASVGFVFGGWNGTGTGAYTGNSVSPPISVAGPVTEFATFGPMPRHPLAHFNETFAASVVFPSGTTWSVKINGTSYAGIGSTIVVRGLPAGTYTATVSGATSADGLTKWSPVSPSVATTVSGDGQTPVAFGKPSFWVTVGGSSGGTETPSSGWEVAGTTLSLNASANLGETFVNWTGTGSESYTGNASATTVTVEAPLTEFATFAPVAPAAVQVTSVWSSGTTWAILGLVGLLVGLIVGIAVRRMRAAPAAPVHEPDGADQRPVAASNGGSP